MSNCSEGAVPAGQRAADTTGYLRVRPAVHVAPGTPLTLGLLADVEGPRTAVEAVCQVPFGLAPEAGGHRIVGGLELAAAARRSAPTVHWQLVGECDTVVLAQRPGRRAHWALGAAAWLLLFVGAATTLINFHADVNMPAAHRQLYFLATGRHRSRPLVIEIPYAVGVGLGALLFFAVPRGAGGDPGPLELEIAQYQERLLAYFRGRRDRSRP